MAKQSSRTTNHTSDKTMFGWVSGVVERVGADRVGNYLGVERVSNALGEAMQGAARTKARVDRNIEVLFTLANLPSKRDYQSLQTKLDTLQGALMNLNRKLDHLTRDLGAGTSTRAARANGRASSTRAKANGAARKTAAKSSSARKSPRKSAAKSTGKASSSSRTSRARGRKSKPRR